jgi:FixJ family two-component response regulator
MTDAVTVHLVDDDESYLKAATRMLVAENFRVAAFPSARLLLAAVTPATRGCVVADLGMPEVDGLALQAALARSGVHLPVVFLSGQGDIPSTVRAMQGGAVDFLEKHAPRENLVAAIRRALERDAAEQVHRAQHEGIRQRFNSLSRRELEVLREVLRGRMNKQIAASLGISERTVKLHRTSIKAKIGVNSAAQLATLARDAELFGDWPQFDGAHSARA